MILHFTQEEKLDQSINKLTAYEIHWRETLHTYYLITKKKKRGAGA